MTLFLKNNFNMKWEKSNDDIITEFLGSRFFADETRSYEVRLALFIAVDLDSTFASDEFNELADKLHKRLNFERDKAL